jgi:hypothetical protein
MMQYYPNLFNDTFFELRDYFDIIEEKRGGQKYENGKYIDEYLNFMGMEAGFNKSDLTKRYRQLCVIMHPDKGGNNTLFIKLLKAKNELLKRL